MIVDMSILLDLGFRLSCVFLLIVILRMGSAKSEGTKPKITLQLFEMSEQKRLLRLYIHSSHLAADVAGRAQQKALTRLPGGYCG